MHPAVVIWWSEEDELYVAEVPELPGCMAYGGDRGEALDNIMQAMELWLDTTRELGRPIPKPQGRVASMPALA